MGINPVLLSGSAALILSIGLVVGIGVVALLTGVLNFLFARPRLTFLKTAQGDSGLAFVFSWNNSDEPAYFDTLSLRCFNPFGHPTQTNISKSFEPSNKDFARDINLGQEFVKLVNTKGLDESIVSLQISSTRDGIAHYFEMKGRVLKDRLRKAKQTFEEYNNQTTSSSRPLYHQSSREFIAEPMGDIPEKVLKIPTNPQFAPDFLGLKGTGAKEESTQENFSVKKVWIDPGCIVCDACEGIYPEVFEVLDDTCIIRENAPLTNGILIEEAAEACPVEVIKFERA